MQPNQSRGIAPDSPLEFIVHGAQFMAPLCAAGLFLPILTSLLSDYQNTFIWLLDLASHWQWLFLVGLIVSSMIAAFEDRKWLIGLLLMPMPWLTASEPAPRHAGVATATLSIASANVHLGNTNTAPLIKWLSEANPDIVMLLEVSPAYAAGLVVLPGYPYRHIEPREHPFGMALLSSHPFIDVRTVQDSEFVIHIDATVNWQGHSIKVVAMHPMPPLSPEFHADGNRQLHDLASEAARSGIPSILAGDLNTTPWGAAFDGLDVKRATSLQPTWPTRYAGIPIDHVLVSGHWKLLDMAVGPKIGSDHLPVMTTLVR